MPTVDGTSVLGLQRLILVPDPAKSRFVIALTGTTTSQRLVRYGTVLLCQNNPFNVQQRVLDVYKLYGNGIIAARSEVAFQFGFATELWVNWFIAPATWRAIIPD